MRRLRACSADMPMNNPAGPQNITALAFFQRQSTLVAVLCTAGVILGLGYVILPGIQFALSLLLLLILVTGLVKPVYTFYLMLFILVEEMVHLFITYNPIYSVRLYPYFVPLLATVSGIAFAKAARRFDLVRSPIDLLLLMVVAYETFSILWAPHFMIGVWLIVLLMLNYLLFFVAKNIVRDEIILRRAVRIWITAGIIAAASIAASQWITYEKIIYFTPTSGLKMAFEEQVSRPAGLAGVDHVAGFTSMALFLTLGAMAAEKRTGMKFFYLILVLLMLTGIVLTTSRGVIIGVVGAYIFFLIMHSHFKGKYIRYLVLFVVVVLFTVLVAKPGFIDRMLIGFGYTGDLLFSTKAYTGTEANTSAGQGLSGMEIRWIWWKNGFKQMSRNPMKLIFGEGVGGFYYYSTGGGGTTVTSPEANGIIPAFFFDMGIFGSILFIILVIIIASSLVRTMRKAKRTYSYYILLGATSALIAETGIHGLIDYDLTSYGSKYFWFPLGFTMAVLNLVQKQLRGKASSLDATD